jgi:ATP-dependent Lhr-like helicase
MLCLTGDVGWARLSSGPTQVVGATPIALFLREQAEAWVVLRPMSADAMGDAARVLTDLHARGASFRHEIAARLGLDDRQLRTALEQLTSAGLVSSDGFAGLRSIIGTADDHRRRPDQSGRWFPRLAALARDGADAPSRDAAIEALAWTLLRRYGVVFRRILAREDDAVTWRELARVYRRLEARGEIRGGRFVSGMSGEQFALPDAVDHLREIRRSAPDHALVTISAADPLNLTGIVTPGDRLRAAAGNRIVYRNGVPLAAMEGDMLRVLAESDPDTASRAAAAAAGRRVPVVSGYVGRAGARG